MDDAVYRGFSDELMKIASAVSTFRSFMLGRSIGRKKKSISESKDRRVASARRAGALHRVQKGLKKLKRRRIRHARKR